MKFSHTLSLNANPDWADHYIDYAALKKIINEIAAARGTESFELTEEEMESDRETFLEKLTKMVRHVREFYDKIRAELDTELARLQPMLEKSASRQDLLSLTEDEPLMQKKRRLRPVSTVGSTGLENRRSEICDLFTQYHNLKMYASLNVTAVTKILKKYDKAMHDDMKTTHIQSLKVLLPFWDGTPDIERALDTLRDYFAHFYCNDDTDEALRRLKLMVREMVTYQRHSVWLDVIQDHRRHEAAHTSAPVLTSADETEKPKSIVKQIQSSIHTQLGIAIVCIFLALLWLPINFSGDPVKQNALALLVFVSLLWAAETLPLFVTAMLVPFLAVTLRIIVVDGRRLDATSASQHVFSAMFSHVIMLLIGGFCIAAALSKHNIAKVAASVIARRFGNGIRTVLVVNMFIATIASMWISNVAAPVLCYSLIAPILKAATAQTSRAAFGTPQQLSAERDQRLCKALVMGIALASDVGGMASPISSPQNLFAIEYTPIGWIAWFVVSIPLCTVLNILIWAWLVFCYELPAAESKAVAYALQRDRLDSEKFSPTQYFVMIVSISVVLLWCASVNMQDLTGQMGILGIVPLVLFFGTGILSNEDLNNFLWSVVILAMGGLVLGDSIKSSGLIDVIAENIGNFIEEHSLGLWETFTIFTLLVLVCTTFVSHTVGAIVIIPIVQAIGTQMQPISHAKELVFATALTCSAAMGLPVSGFPNMTAVAVEDNLGNRFLLTKDFLKYAVPASLFSWSVIVTMGYWLIAMSVQIDKL